MAVQQIRASVYELSPLEDGRWKDFIHNNKHSSAFHTPGWLEALRRTYGYEPVVLTSAGPREQIAEGIVFCRVNSWLTGRRLVALPFSDHCELLGNDPEELRFLISAAEKEVLAAKLNYMEIRPQNGVHFESGLLHSTESYAFHHIDLRPDLGSLFQNCHKDSTQRKIRRAEREGLRYEEGRSPALLEAFYRLLLLTRRRHQVPPQPRVWFENLADCMGEALKVRVVFKASEPAAAIITLSHKNILLYKYGCSNARFHNLGGMHLLFWRSIEGAKQQGLTMFDLGRSDLNNQGLITFKDRWGSTRSTLTYSRYSRERRSGYTSAEGWKQRSAKRLVSFLPGRVFEAVGKALYRHIG